MKAERPLRLILAEDNFAEIWGIRQSAKEIGHEVVAEVSTGEAAIEQTCLHMPDAVLMDIDMPGGMGGLDATEQIQEHCPTPVVVITGFQDQEMVETASRKGVGAYLTKPSSTAEIERAITIAIARHKDLMKYRQLSEELERRNLELKKALEEINVLHGILPICSYCKKIREEAGDWKPIEQYIRDRSEAEFSHSICPDCAEKHYPEFDVY